jgi:MFS family permease
MFFADYLLFGIAYALTSPSAVVPEFISQLTTDERIIGLAGSMSTLVWLAPQLLFSQFVTRGTRRKPFIYVSPTMRTMIPLLAILIAVFGGPPINTAAILISFFITSGLFWIGDGLVTIAWADMLGSSLDPKARSRLYGFGQFAVAIGALGAREIAARLLAPEGPMFPFNYAALFGVAGVIFVAGGISLALLKEEDHGGTVQPGPSLREFLPYIGNILREDGKFRHFIITRLFFDLSTLALPFYILLGTDVLKQDSSRLVGDSILLTTLGNVGMSLFNGWLSSKFGARAVIRGMSFFKVGMPAAALFCVATGNVAGIHAAFFMLGAINGAFTPGFFDWLITHAPQGRRPIYVGLTNTISAFGNIAPLIGGVILNYAKNANAGVAGGDNAAYAILFWIALGAAAIGGLLTLGLSEPREPQLAAT